MFEFAVAGQMEKWIYKPCALPHVRICGGFSGHHHVVFPNGFADLLPVGQKCLVDRDVLWIGMSVWPHVCWYQHSFNV